MNSHTVHFNINGKQEKIAFNQNVQGLTIFKNGQSHKFGYIQQNFSAEDEQGTEGNLKAPMPGVITQVLVASNDHVKKGDVLMTLEAMKMEYSIRAPHDGIILTSYFQAGDQVKVGDELVEFQILAEESA